MSRPDGTKICRSRADTRYGVRTFLVDFPVMLSLRSSITGYMLSSLNGMFIAPLGLITGEDCFDTPP